ncbi:MAG: hypothetical protein ACM3ZE_20330 [Myxococcales bacterium]
MRRLEATVLALRGAPQAQVKAASVLLPTTALAPRVLAPPKFVLVAKLLRANGRSGGFACQFSILPPDTRSA